MFYDDVLKESLEDSFDISMWLHINLCLFKYEVGEMLD